MVMVATTDVRKPSRRARTTRKPTPFGQMIRDLRMQREISQAELAHQCGISPGYVGLIETGERGERPSLDIVRAFAQALRVDIETEEKLLRVSGHLGEHETLIQPDRPSFATFVSADNRLTKGQKKLLISMYESWFGGASVA